MNYMIVPVIPVRLGRNLAYKENFITLPRDIDLHPTESSGLKILHVNASKVGSSHN